jgi:DNA protecting protein DprA
MNLIFPLQLMLARGIGNAFIHRFADFILRYGELDGETIINSVDKLTSTFGIKSDLASSIVDARKNADQLLESLSESGIKIVWLIDENYPNRLKTVLGKDVPSVLFYRGNLNLCKKGTVGFCGSRHVSAKGITITEKCTKQLTDKNICIISGYANGVDMTAHRTALQKEGETVIVLAEGLFNFREKQDIKRLLRSDNCLIISQFLPNTVWSGRNAMTRNSVIIGLSDVMILIESGLTGGTYAAGNECLRRNHPLFIVDYQDPSDTLANPEFIRRGGLPIRGNRDGEPNLEHLLSIIQYN